MTELAARVFSQGLQAFMPAAVWLVWLWRSGQRRQAAAMRYGLIAAIPLTVLAGWGFQASESQAQWEASLALAAVVVALACARAVWISAGAAENHALAATAAGAAAIVVRQTMLIAAVWSAAAWQMRSTDATVAITVAAGLALAAAAGWTWIGARLSLHAVQTATRAFVALFLAQAALYALHRSAEARFLPWGAALDAATEPYGPDGIFGRDISTLLFLVPVAVAATVMIRDRAWQPTRRRAALLTSSAAIAIVCLVAGVTKARDALASRGGAGIAAPSMEVASIVAVPHTIFLSQAGGSGEPVVSVAPLAAVSRLAQTSLRCERIAFAAGRGVCLQAVRGPFTTYRAVLFDAQFRPGGSFPLDGIPSRTRVSADGRVGAITVFVAGHAYSASTFSTRTVLLDMATGGLLGDLEQFTTWRDGRRFSAPDFNFWGVTFARDSNIFYASLRTVADVEVAPGRVERRQQTFLVRGDVQGRTLTVLHGNVECPSLSPDNRSIAYKKFMGPGPAPWRFFVLDLSTMRERPVPGETRSIDDQIEWLDDAHVLYGALRPRSPVVDVYVAAIDGGEPPRVFLPAAASPIVVR